MATYYNPRIITNGLVLHLDAANLKSYPRSGNNWTDLVTLIIAGLKSGATFSSSNLGSISFDGTDDYVDLNDFLSILPTGSQITVSIWQNNSNIGSRSSFGAVDSGATRTFQAHIPWSDNNVYWDSGGSGAYDRINKITTLAERTGWHNWVFTKNSTSGVMKIYLDGVEWHSGTGKFYTMSTPTSAVLGAYNSSTFQYSGNIAIFSIYRRELTQREILDNFNTFRGRFGL